MRKILTGLFMLVFTVSATAQKIEFGIKGGVNVARFSSAISGGYKNLVSGHGGGFAQIKITKAFAVQPEILYSGQGAKYYVIGELNKYSLSYINVPVLFQLITEAGVRIETGPQLGFLLSAKRKADSLMEDRKGVFYTTDFSWAFGASYLSKYNFGIYARYNLGISDLARDENLTLKNTVVQAGLFYRFHN